MSEHDHSDFLKTDTPANACTLSDRKLREAFRASLDAPEEHVGMLDQLTARIALLKTEQKVATVNAKKKDAPVEVAAETKPVQAPVDPQPQAAAVLEEPVSDEPQDEEGELFAHLNEIMSERKGDDMPELSPEPGMEESKSVIVRTFASLMPKRKPKPAQKLPLPKEEKAKSGSIIVRALSGLMPKKKAAAPSVVTEAAPIMEKAEPKPQSKSVIVRMLSGLKPKSKPKAQAKPKAENTLHKDASGSIVIGLLKAISPIKRSA